MQPGYGFKEDEKSEMTTFIFNDESLYKKVINKLFYINMIDDEIYLYIEPDVNNTIKYKIFDKDMIFVDSGEEMKVERFFDRLLLDQDNEVLVEATDIENAKMLLVL